MPGRVALALVLFASLSRAEDDCSGVVMDDPAGLSLLQLRSDIVTKPKAGGNLSSLNEKGYQAVVALKDNAEMSDFIQRTAVKLGYSIAPGGAGPLRGFVPFFSGVKAKKNFKALEAELQKAADLPKSWLAPRGATAPIDEDGFAAVANLKDNEEMETFVKRMAADFLDMEVHRHSGLKRMVPNFSGVKHHKPYSALKDALYAEAKKKHHSWLVAKSAPVRNEGKDCAHKCSDALKKGKPCDHYCGKGNMCAPSGRFGLVCTKMISGANQPLNEAGFAVVQSMKSNAEMEKFVRRLADTLDMSVHNEKAFRVIVSFYSGVKDSRSYDALLEELNDIVKQPHSWITPRGETASLDEDGFKIIAKLSSADEMSKFIVRAVYDKGLYVKNKKWLDDLSKFYSSQKKGSGYDALEAELKDIKDDGVNFGKAEEPKAEAPKDADKAKDTDKAKNTDQAKDKK